MKFVILIFLIASSSLVNCQLTRPLAQGIAELKSGVNAGHLVNNCKSRAFSDHKVLQSQGTGNTFTIPTPDRRDYSGYQISRSAMYTLEVLKFGKKVMLLDLQSTISPRVSAVIVKAAIGTRDSTGKIEYVTGISTTTCQMIPKQDRVFNPEELALTYDYILDKSARELSSKLGLGSTSITNMLGGINSSELNNLKKLFSDMQYIFNEADNVPAKDLLNSIKDLANGLLKDTSVLSKIQSVASGASRSSFAVSISSSTMFVIAVNKQASEYGVKVSMISTRTILPSNAFAYSVGQWSIVNRGTAASPSFDVILKNIPGLK